MRNDDPALRLVCFPHSGGSASTYQSWVPLMPEDVELIAVQYPQRAERFTEPPAGSVAEMGAAVAAELGYRNGPLTFDAVLQRDDELYLIEVGARMGGNGIAEVVRHCHGVDLMAATMSLAVGEVPVLDPHPPVPALVHILASDRAGLLAKIDGLAEVRAMPEVKDLHLFVTEGSFVRPYEQAGYKLGYVVVSAESTSALWSVENAVRGTLKFQLDAGDASRATNDVAVPER